MARPWMDLMGSVGGATPPNVFAPFGTSAIMSYHSVKFAIQPYVSVNSAIVVYPVAAFFRLASLFMLSDWISGLTRASKSSIVEMY